MKSEIKKTAAGSIAHSRSNTREALAQLPLDINDTATSLLWTTTRCEEDRRAAPTIVAQHLSPLKVTAAYESYWRFAAERQHIFFKRAKRVPQPWTRNSVLSTYKFTNAYRASDRVSQYLIRNVIYRDDLPSSSAEVFFRIILFKLFNKIETWGLLETELGSVTHAEYNFERYCEVLGRAESGGGKVGHGSGGIVQPRAE